MTCAWLQQRIAHTQAVIAAAEEQELQLASGLIQSYTIDTGQSRQTVTNVNSTEYRKYMDSLYNRYKTQMAAAGNGGTVISVPAW